MFQKLKALLGWLLRRPSRAAEEELGQLVSWEPVPYSFHIDWYAPSPRGDRYLLTKDDGLSPARARERGVCRLLVRRKP